MPIEVVYSDKSDSENYIWDFKHGDVSFLHLEIDNQPVYGITWNTRVPTEQGLDAIRQSYQRLKRGYIETHELEPIRRLPILKDDPTDTGTIVGPVTFVMAPAWEHYIAIEMGTFLNATSLRAKPGERNPIGWIRVNAGYLSYYFQGEAFYPQETQRTPRSRELLEIPSRDFGVLGNHRATEEIVTLFGETSATKLPHGDLMEVHQTLEKLLETFPELVRR